MSPEIVADLVSLATTSNPYSCRKLAQHVQAEYGVRVSSETIRRYLGQAGMKHGLPRYVPALTPLHRQKRVAFAQKHVKRTSFSSWMFTDSKIFLLSKAQSKQGVKVWYAKGARPIVQVKHGTLGLHVYIGVTKYGITEPCFVTGAGSHKSSYANTRTGAMYRGVCAAEYQEQVLPHLVKEGNLVCLLTEVGFKSLQDTCLCYPARPRAALADKTSSWAEHQVSRLAAEKGAMSMA